MPHWHSNETSLDSLDEQKKVTNHEKYTPEIKNEKTNLKKLLGVKPKNLKKLLDKAKEFKKIIKMAMKVEKKMMSLMQTTLRTM